MKFFKPSYTQLISKLNFKLFSVLLITGILISSCGFHLRGFRGSYKFPFSKVYLMCDTTVICRNLYSAIKTQSLATIVNSPESADVTIQLSNEETSRQPVGFNAAGRISGYLLIYQVQAKVLQNHQQLGNTIKISAQNTMNYSDSQILSANQNEAAIWESLHEDATNQLIRMLVYFKYYKKPPQNESYAR